MALDRAKAELVQAQRHEADEKMRLEVLTMQAEQAEARAMRGQGRN